MIRRENLTVSGPGAVAIGRDALAPVTTNVIQMFGASLVPVAEAVKDPASIFATMNVDAFTGRQWLAGEVDRFLAAYPRGYVLVEAEAGLGKTAFAAWLVKTRGYISHFSLYSGGSSMPVALGNLSAQLIIGYGLEDRAPGGMLPGSVQSPDGFESLLAVAAERAYQQGRRPVVLVVDGMDEAEVPERGLPWGLPRVLPDGVYVVGTYRTGRAPGRPDTPTLPLTIGKDDQRNQGDIREYLAKVVAEEALAARLAEAHADPAEFTRLLAERCGGVWVYLRYVLDELRRGLRRADTISDLPSGLRGYYAGQIDLWQQDPAWDTGLLPLLATLGVAGEALPVATLARLAGDVDQALVRRWCGRTLRPLLTATGTPLRYAIYHASFREVVDPRDDDPAAPAPSEWLELADEFRQATAIAHDRICDFYLALFGGLAAGLPTLAGDPGVADVDDGYPLRHLARHLCSAGRAADLHALLAADHPAGPGRAVNTWFAAQEYAGSIVSYLDDLARTRNDAAAATDKELGHHRPAVTLGLEIRYAVMAASIAGLTGGVGSDLLGQLIRTGVWSLRRGLDHARRIADPEARLKALLTIHDLLPEAEQPAVLALALAAAAAISVEPSRGRALKGLAPLLPPGLLEGALAAAAAISSEIRRAEALAGLAPFLPPDVLGQALAAAGALTDDYARAMVLTALASHLPVTEQPDVLAQALAAADGAERGVRGLALDALVPLLPADLLPQALAAVTRDSHALWVLVTLAPRLPPDLLRQALAVVTAIPDDYLRAQALAALAPWLPAAEQPAVFDRALAAAIAITRDRSRAEALTALSARVPAAGQRAVVDRALAAATAVTDDRSRADALALLAGGAPEAEQPAVLDRALAAAITVADDRARVEAVERLAPRLPPGLLAQALTATTAARTVAGTSSTESRNRIAASNAITNDSSRAEALATLAPYLPTDLFGQALGAATTITDDQSRGEALAGLAPYLPTDLFGQALGAATAIVSDSSRARALAALAPHLPSDLLGRALTAATAIVSDSSRAEALAALAPRLPAADQPAVVAQALAAATAIADGYACVMTLRALATRLREDEQPAGMAQALITATAITDDDSRTDALAMLGAFVPSDLMAQVLAAAISDDSFRPKTLATLVPYLPPELRARALAAATSVSVDIIRAGALTTLGTRLPITERPAVLDRALASATAITDGRARASALAALAPHLPPDLLDRALTAAIAIAGDSYRADALTALVPHLPAALLDRVLAAATDIAQDSSRARALTALASRLPPDSRSDLMAQALAAAEAVTDDFSLAEGMAEAVAWMPGAEQRVLAQFLADSNVAVNYYSRADTLAVLAPYLPPGLFGQALAAATAIANDDSRGRALAALAPYLPPGLLGQALAAATAIHSDDTRGRALAALAPRLPPDLLAQAMTVAAAITDDYPRALALAALSPRVPPAEQHDVLDQALAAATAITDDVYVVFTDDSSRPRALTALAPDLPPDLLAPALAATPRTSLRALTAILDQGRSVFPRGQDAPYVALLRDSLTGTGRETCLNVTTEVAPVIAEIGGPDAIEECVKAVVDTQRWWPGVPQDVIDMRRLEALWAQPDAGDPLAALLRTTGRVVYTIRGNGLVRQNRTEDALAAFDQAIALDPASTAAHNYRGLALQLLGRYQDALTAHDQALALEPSSADAHYGRAMALRELGRLEDALTAFDQATALDPGNANAHSYRGQTLQALGRYQEALAAFDRAIALHPGDASAHNGRGMALYGLGRLEDAVAAFGQAVALQPGNAETYYYRGTALHKLRRFDEAVADYDRLLAINPRIAAVHSYRGAALLPLGRFAEALAAFDQALALDPGTGATHLGRGYALLYLGRFEESLAASGQAVGFNARSASAHENKGIALAVMGDLDQALAEFDTADDLAPDGAGEGKAWAAAILWHRRDPDAARDRFALVKGRVAGCTPFCTAALEAIALCGLGQPDDAERHLRAAIPQRVRGDWSAPRTIYDLLSDPPLPGIDRLLAIVDSDPG
jgi:tetratricopeptide (TPR) repeat protein